MKVKNIISKILCCLGLLVILGTCADVMSFPGEKISAGMGRVFLSVAGSGERTIFPEMPEFTKYKFVFEALDGQEGREPLTVNAGGLVNESVELMPGNWTIYAEGYVSISGIEGIEDGEYLAAEGIAENVLVAAGETISISIDITGGIRPGGRGILSWEIILPADAVSASMVLRTLGGEEVTTIDLMDIPQGDMVLDSAYYLLVLNFDNQRPRAEVLYIYGNMTSRVNRSLFRLPSFNNTDNLAEWLGSLPSNTADTPYEIILYGLNLEIDFHEGGDPLYKLYGALQDKFVEIDLSDCEGRIIPDTAYSIIAGRPYKDRIVSVVLPEGITSVGANSFADCSNLALVVYYAEIPPALGVGAFSGTHVNLAKEVPAGSIDTYKAASGWSAYSDRVWAAGSVRFIVTFDTSGADGTAPSAQTVLAGSGITIPGGNEFYKTGYVFGGWNTSPDSTGTAYSAGDFFTPIGNITLYAKWVLETAFVITLGDMNEWDLVEQKVQVDANVNQEFTAGEANYESYQWYLDGALVGTDPVYVFNAGAGIYELFVVVSNSAGETRSGRCRVTVEQKFNVIFIALSGIEVPVDMLVEDGCTIDRPDNPVRSGFAFIGWYKESGFINPWNFSSNTVTKDEILYGRWEALPSNHYTVRFIRNGGTPFVEDLAVESGGTMSEPVVTKDGYTFGGWFKDTACTDDPWLFDDDTVTGNVVLYAKWNQADYFTLNFVINGGTPIPAQRLVLNGSAIERPQDNPVRTGFTFCGWYTESGFANLWDFAFDTITKNENLYAKWEELPPDHYNVRYIRNGGSPFVEDLAVESGGMMSEPVITRDGSTFGGWFKDPACTNDPWLFDDDVVNGNITLYAKWNPVNHFTINFIANGGTPAPAQQVVAYAGIVNQLEITREYYIFGGWYTESDFVTEWVFASDRVMHNLNLYAKWYIGTVFIDQEITSSGTYQLRHNKDDEDILVFSADEDLRLVTERVSIEFESLQLIGGGGRGGTGGTGDIGQSGGSISAVSGGGGGGGGSGYYNSFNDIAITDIDTISIVVGDSEQATSVIVNEIVAYNADNGENGGNGLNGNAAGGVGGIGENNGNNGSYARRDASSNSTFGGASADSGHVAGGTGGAGWIIDGFEYGKGGDGGLSGRGSISVSSQAGGNSASGNRYGGAAGSLGNNGYAKIVAVITIHYTP